MSLDAKRYLNSVEQIPQTQESLHEQLKVLRHVAAKLGLYDAADHLRQTNEETERRL
jgi:hypothetical protein